MSAYPRGRWTGHYAGMWHSDEPPEYSDPEDEDTQSLCRGCGVRTSTWYRAVPLHDHHVRCALAAGAAHALGEALQAVAK